MNWLAHVYLSEASIHFQLGNLLADSLKGRVWEGAPSEFVAGVAMHRRIDRFTDADASFRSSKQRLGDRGFLRGIVVDLLYDHFLSKNWRQFSDTDLDAYLETFYGDAKQVLQGYPPHCQEFVRSLIHSGRLGTYREFAGIESAIEFMDRRLSARLRRREQLRDYLPRAVAEVEALERDFLQFFPKLVEHVELGS